MKTLRQLFHWFRFMSSDLWTFCHLHFTMKPFCHWRHFVITLSIDLFVIHPFCYSLSFFIHHFVIRLFLFFWLTIFFTVFVIRPFSLFIVICSLCHSLFYNLFFCCSIRCFCHFLFFSWYPFWYFFNCLFVISHLLFSRCHSHFLSFALWPLLFLAHPFLSFAFYFVDLFGVWQKAIRTFCHSFFC